MRKEKIIAFRGAYHGDTFGSMSVADRGLFTKPFFPYLFETSFIDFPDTDNDQAILEQFKKLIAKKDVAGFIFEPLVQGASGMRMYSAALLDELIAYAQQEKVICIADEVFSGFGRTGKSFATDYLQSKPDIMCLSKGITGGFLPLGVTACSEKVIAAFDSGEFEKTFFHGHSYTANPLACAAANASFELLTDDDCQKRILGISDQHKTFAKSIQKDKHIAKVATLGTIVALTLVSGEDSAYENSLRKKIYTHFLGKNILLRPLGNVIYVIPPYVISDAELSHIYREIEFFLSTI